MNYTRPDAGELIDIPDQQHLCVRRNCLQERMGQEEVQHGGFVYNEGLRLERVVFVVAEAHRFGVEGEQAMNRFGLLFGHFCQSLRGASRWRGKQDGFAHRSPQVHDGPGRKRLATSRSSSEHQQARGRRQFDRAALLLREGDASFLCVGVDPALHAREEIDPNRCFDKGGETRGEGLLRVVKRGRVADALGPRGLRSQPAR